MVLGVDMAHVGRRYGDAAQRAAGEGAMARVAARDRGGSTASRRGDADGLLAPRRRRRATTCAGAGPRPSTRSSDGVGARAGELLRYEQWNIDEESVVSFAGLAFRERPAA